MSRLRSLLITLTVICRDSQSFDALRELLMVSPAERTTEQCLRLWGSCCVTDGEVYSIAMVASGLLAHPLHLAACLLSFGRDLAGRA